MIKQLIINQFEVNILDNFSISSIEGKINNDRFSINDEYRNIIFNLFKGTLIKNTVILSNNEIEDESFQPIMFNRPNNLIHGIRLKEYKYSYQIELSSYEEVRSLEKLLINGDTVIYTKLKDE